MKLFKRLFFKKNNLEKDHKNDTREVVNRNYVCLASDPINTINLLSEGDWNTKKVNEGLSMGILRHPKQCEVDKAIELNRIKSV